MKKYGIIQYPYSLEILHADWPAYPRGHSLELVLEDLARFPYNSTLYEIDDIDKCMLFTTTDPNKLDDPFKEDYMHVAIWHEDLLLLKSSGYVEGVFDGNDPELWQLEAQQAIDSFRKIGASVFNETTHNFTIKYGDKNITFSKIPDRENEDSEFLLSKEIHLPWRYFRLTDRGHKAIQDIMKNPPVLHETIYNHVTPLIDIGYYGTAVRDISVLLESTLKKIHGDGESLFGAALIRAHESAINKFSKENHLSLDTRAYIKDLKQAFFAIRNKFAHQFNMVDLGECYANLRKLNTTYEYSLYILALIGNG